MKYTLRLAFCAPICIAASFVTASSASAATVLLSSGVAQLSTSSTAQLLNTGTQKFAWDVGGNVASTTVNGITFSNAQPTTGEGAVTVPAWAGTITNGATTAYAAAGAGMQELLSDFYYTAQGAGFSNTVTLNNLVNGQEYRIQFLHYQEGTAAAAREMEVFFGGTSGTSTGVFAAGGSGNGYISTFDFVADSTGQQLFTFRSSTVNGADDRALLNAATLFAVPEPSAALLGGLGMLALLRRRRA